MKPNFALSLFFDKVELLHRDGAEWTSIGEVAFDAEDLPAALSALRKKALTHDPAGLRTKLILPDEQIKFLALPDDNATDADVRAALKDATPYEVDELVYEFTSHSRRTFVAAVAKETLEEAEAFAVEHRFAPVSIVAQPVVGRFDGEPFFGQTKAAAGLIGPDEVVERDNLPAALVPLAPPEPDPTPKAPDPEPEPEVDTAPEIVPATKADPKPAPLDAFTDKASKTAKPAAEPAPAKAPEAPKTPPKAEEKSAVPVAKNAEPDPKADTAKPAPKPDAAKPPPEEPKAKTKADKPKPKAEKPAPKPKGETPAAKDPAPKTDDAPSEEPVFASRARSADVKSGTIEQAVTALRQSDVPETETRPRSVPIVTTPGPQTEAQAKVAERLARATRTNVTADRISDVPPASVAPVPDRPKSTKAAAKAPSVSTPAVATSPKAIAATLTPPATPPADPESGLFASRRKEDPAGKIPPLADPRVATPEPLSTKKPRGKTVFDDQPADTRGRPRFMLLILTAILLLFMAAVAAWASLFTEDGIAGLFGRGDTAEIADDPILTAAPSDTTPLAPLTAPSVGASTALVVPGSTDPVATTVTATSLLASTVPPANGGLDGGLDAAVTAVPAPPVEERALLDPPVVTPDTPRGTVLSPAEADRFYAATGVWLRAPRLPVLPRSTQLDAVAQSSTEAAYQSKSQPTGLPELAALFPDTGLATQLNPPAADVVFERDARGLLVATAEGTVSPYGMLIYAGQPGVVPPTRPGTPLPEPVIAPEPVEEAEEPVVAEAPAETETEAVTATLEALIAETLTEDLPEAETEVAAETAQTDPLRDARGLILASADGTVTEGLIVFAGSPSVVPPSRPAAPEGLVDETSAEALEETDTTQAAEALVPYEGVRPVVRPQDIAAVEEPEAVMTATFAGPRPVLRPRDFEDAAATPVEPQAPEIDDTTVAATLAAIVAAAPDPLATATPLAVAQAVVPAPRPRNFDRVVAAAQARQASTVATTTTTTTTTATQPTAVSSAAVQPTGPVPQSVAAAATIEGAINLRQINLIGVFGRPNDRRALVRLGNGSFVRVGVGDSLDGGQVTAIGDNVINYVKRGRTIALGVPG